MVRPHPHDPPAPGRAPPPATACTIHAGHMPAATCKAPTAGRWYA